MKIILAQIPKDGIEFEFSFAKEKLLNQNDEIELSKPTKDAKCEFFLQLKKDNLIVRCKIFVFFEHICVRCLQKIENNFVIDDVVVFINVEKKDVVDLSDYVREEILLQLDLNPKCEKFDKKCKKIKLKNEILFTAFDESEQNSRLSSLSKKNQEQLEKLNKLKFDESTN